MSKLKYIPLDCQKAMIQRTIASVLEHKRVLSIAPTGAGKTVMMGYIIRELIEVHGFKKIVQIVHRTAILEQNFLKMKIICDGLVVKKFDAKDKDYDCDILCAMAQSLLNSDLVEILKDVDCIVIDEAHHGVANGYLKITNSCHKDTRIVGFTATPERSDGKTLRILFNAVGYQLTNKECIEAGLNIPMKDFVLTHYGTQKEIQELLKVNTVFEVAKAELLDKSYLNELIVTKWKEKCPKRQTVAFCSNIKHAQNLANTFRRHGFPSEYVASTMPKADRDAIMSKFEQGDIKILCNVEILTEGYDCPFISCIILALPITTKTKLIQIRGRGLRAYENKTDCYFLDFGNSLFHYPDLTTKNDLKPIITASAKTKITITETETSNEKDNICPNCEAIILSRTEYCPICNTDINNIMRKKLIDLEKNSQLVEMTYQDYGHSVFMGITWVRPFRQNNVYLKNYLLCYSTSEAFVIFMSPDGKFVAYKKNLFYDYGTRAKRIAEAKTLKECMFSAMKAIKTNITRFVCTSSPPTKPQITYLAMNQALKFIDIKTTRRECSEMIICMRACRASGNMLYELGLNSTSIKLEQAVENNHITII